MAYSLFPARDGILAVPIGELMYADDDLRDEYIEINSPIERALFKLQVVVAELGRKIDEQNLLISQLLERRKTTEHSTEEWLRRQRDEPLYHPHPPNHIIVKQDTGDWGCI